MDIFFNDKKYLIIWLPLMIQHMPLEISDNVSFIRTFGTFYTWLFSTVGSLMNIQTFFLGVRLLAFVTNVFFG